MVTRLKLATPLNGILTLSEADPDPALFHMAKVGLGSLGVVTELTVKVIITLRYEFTYRLFMND
jgi:L-galactono-1,4-lactone dehydrogenase